MNTDELLTCISTYYTNILAQFFKSRKVGCVCVCAFLSIITKVTLLIVVTVGEHQRWGNPHRRCRCNVVNKMRLPLSTNTALLWFVIVVFHWSHPSSMLRQYAPVLGCTYKLGVRNSLEYWSTLAQFYIVLQ
jgi:hypothetical protein